MSQLEDIIKDEIRKEGPVTFARFMELALYHPEYGYYGGGRVAIGRAGDYYTSPHVSDVFGRLVAETYLKLKDRVGGGECHFVEMGAGHGYVARDFLGQLAEFHGDELASCRYIIVERSEVLRDRQRETLGDMAGNVEWFGSLDEIETPLDGVFFSNELLDAFPFHRVVQTPDRLNELYVTYGADGFKLSPGPLSTPDIPTYLNRLGIRLKDGVTTEINLDVCRWMDAVVSTMKSGFVVTVDYGYPALEYYSPERDSGTMMCYKGHKASEDPFRDIGEQDITAHVDFTSLSLEGNERGLVNVLYTSQSSFLADAATCLEELVERTGSNVLEDVGKGLINLVHPDIMGSVFKVMVQARMVDSFGLFRDVKNRIEELYPVDSCSSTG